MIIDLILDRKDNDELENINPEDVYEANDFYLSVWTYGEIGNEITRAMDYGNEIDVKLALCKYILKNGYNPDICAYICSREWLVNDLPDFNSPEAFFCEPD